MKYLVLSFFALVLMSGCGEDSSSQDEDTTEDVVQEDMPTADTDPGDTTTMTGALGMGCTDNPSSCGEFVCASEFNSAIVDPVCTMDCDRGVECPRGFECGKGQVGSGYYCWVDDYVIVDLEFTNISPEDGGIGMFRTEMLLDWDVTQPAPYNPEPRADSYDVYHGETMDPPLLGTDVGEFGVYAPVEDGKTYYWRIVAHQGEEQFESPVYSYQAQAISTACPGNESATVGGVEVPTVMIGDQCWLSANHGIGEDPVNSYALDDGVIQRDCVNTECSRGLYTWYEAHNAYPDTVGDVSAGGICPSGFRLPTRAEFETLMTGNINGLRTGYGFHLDGQVTPTTGDIELCPLPGNPMNMVKCTRMGSSTSSDGFYWTSETTASEAYRLQITHEGGGVYTHQIRTARPAFACSVRCIAN